MSSRSRELTRPHDRGTGSGRTPAPTAGGYPRSGRGRDSDNGPAMYAVEVVALQGLGLVVDRGELMALVGASGSRRPDAGRDKIETPTVLDLQLKRAVHGERQRIAEELPEMRGGWKATR